MEGKAKEKDGKGKEKGISVFLSILSLLLHLLLPVKPSFISVKN